MARVPGEETRPIHWRMPMSQYEAAAQEAERRDVPLSQIYREAMGVWMAMRSQVTTSSGTLSQTATLSMPVFRGVPTP